MPYQYTQLPSGLLDISNYDEMINQMRQDAIEQPTNLLVVQEQKIDPLKAQQIGSAAQALAQQQAARQAYLATLTPGEVAAQNAMAIPNLANMLTPMPVKVIMNILGIPAFGSTHSGGVSKSSLSPLAGIAFGGNVGQVANAVTTANLAAAAGGRGSGPGGMSGNVGIGGGATASGVGTGIGGLGGIGGGL